MQNWSIVVCKAIFDVGGYNSQRKPVHMGMKSIQKHIREVENALISKQFLHKKLSRLIAAGLVSRAEISSKNNNRRRGRPTNFAYFLTKNGLNYLKMKGVLDRGDNVLMSKKLDILVLEAPEKVKPEDFVKEYYKKLGFEAVKRKELVHIEMNLPPEVVDALNKENKGVPDFFVHKSDFSEYFFVECKTPDTGLSTSQTQWILSNPNMPLKLVYVKREKDIEQRTGLVRIYDDDYSKLIKLTGAMRTESGRRISVAEAFRYAVNQYLEGKGEQTKIIEQREKIEPQWHKFSHSEKQFMPEDSKTRPSKTRVKMKTHSKITKKSAGPMRLFSLVDKEFVDH